MRGISQSMIRILTVAVLALAATAAGAQADPPNPHPHGNHGPKAPKKCKPQSIGFHASGALVSQALTQTAGADTSTKRDDRYSGTVTVDVKRANHRAPAGVQTFTLANDRVHFSHGAAPAAGDRVKLYGKLTRAHKGCTDPAAPVVDLRRVRFKAAAHAG